jgi:hypothetical protein
MAPPPVVPEDGRIAGLRATMGRVAGERVTMVASRVDG